VSNHLKLLFDVIKKLTSEQKAIIQNIGFGTLLQLACSVFPSDVYNWLAMFINTTTGCIELPNGFSFKLTRESVQVIIGLPIGSRPISFTSSPEIERQINLEIHGKERSPSIFELAKLIGNGITGSAFIKSFALLANCLLLCPTNQNFPSSLHYTAIAHEDEIREYDWCSYILQWILLSVNKFQLNSCSGSCVGCGLIPVVCKCFLLISVFQNFYLDS
jgi:hypothetical protein